MVIELILIICFCLCFIIFGMIRCVIVSKVLILVFMIIFYLFRLFFCFLFVLIINLVLFINILMDCYFLGNDFKVDVVVLWLCMLKGSKYIFVLYCFFNFFFNVFSLFMLWVFKIKFVFCEVNLWVYLVLILLEVFVIKIILFILLFWFIKEFIEK